MESISNFAIDLLYDYDKIRLLKQNLINSLYDSDTRFYIMNAYNTINNTNYEATRDNMKIVIEWLNGEINKSRCAIVSYYNNETGDNLEYKVGSFKVAYKYILDKNRITYLEFLVRRLIEKLSNRSGDSLYDDYFFVDNLPFFIKIMIEYGANNEIDIPQKESEYKSQGEINKIIIDTLLEMDPSGMLKEEFIKFYEEGNIISFDENNIEDITQKYGIEDNYLSSTAFYHAPLQKIFYEKTSSLFDAVLIMHEFGHYLSYSNKTHNSLTELFSIYFEGAVIRHLKNIKIPESEISNCFNFRKIDTLEISENLYYILILMSRVINHEAIINEEDYEFIRDYVSLEKDRLSILEQANLRLMIPDFFSEEAALNRMIDQEIKLLALDNYTVNIYNLYPYVLAYYLAKIVLDSGNDEQMLKWLGRDDLTPEEVCETLHINLSLENENRCF